MHHVKENVNEKVNENTYIQKIEMKPSNLKRGFHQKEQKEICIVSKDKRDAFYQSKIMVHNSGKVKN